MKIYKEIQDLSQYNSVNFEDRIKTKPDLESWGKTIKIKIKKKKYISETPLNNCGTWCFPDALWVHLLF